MAKFEPVNIKVEVEFSPTDRDRLDKVLKRLELLIAALEEVPLTVQVAESSWEPTEILTTQYPPGTTLVEPWDAKELVHGVDEDLESPLSHIDPYGDTP